MEIEPQDLLSLVLAAQFELQFRRAYMRLNQATPSERKALGERIFELEQWLTRNNFNTRSEE